MDAACDNEDFCVDPDMRPGGGIRGLLNSENLTFERKFQDCLSPNFPWKTNEQHHSIDQFPARG
jgi:hypothetical protein